MGRWKPPQSGVKDPAAALAVFTLTLSFETHMFWDSHVRCFCCVWRADRQKQGERRWCVWNTGLEQGIFDLVSPGSFFWMCVWWDYPSYWKLAFWVLRGTSQGDFVWSEHVISTKLGLLRTIRYSSEPIAYKAILLYLGPLVPGLFVCQRWSLLPDFLLVIWRTDSCGLERPNLSKRTMFGFHVFPGTCIWKYTFPVWLRTWGSGSASKEAPQ